MKKDERNQTEHPKDNKKDNANQEPKNTGWQNNTEPGLEFGEEIFEEENKNKNQRNQNNDNRSHSNFKHTENSNPKNKR